MEMLIAFGVFLGSFIGMEVIAWATHKYIMHGFLWILHRDHHQRDHQPFEWNDLFALMFAAPAVIFIVLGSFEMDWRFFAGLGITAYGMAYFLVHDVFVHQRVKIFRKARSPYLTALRKAHKIHHGNIHKHGASEFGFLWVHPRYIRQALKASSKNA